MTVIFNQPHLRQKPSGVKIENGLQEHQENLVYFSDQLFNYYFFFLTSFSAASFSLLFCFSSVVVSATSPSAVATFSLASMSVSVAATDVSVAEEGRNQLLLEATFQAYYYQKHM